MLLQFLSQQTSERESNLKYGIQSSGILRHVDRNIVTDFSKDLSASFFIVKQSKKWEGSV
jgi:hypothetical protein